MKALVTEQGTACAETALCDKCYAVPENRANAIAERWEDAIRDSWTDCTGNDACPCIICGKKNL